MGATFLWSQTALVLDQLAITRGERLLVSGISCALAGGDAVALIGPNGSGKTSLLRALAGLATPSSGSLALTVDGHSFPPPLSALVHFAGHQDGLKASLSVRQNLIFWQRYLSHAAIPVSEALDHLAVGHLIDLPVGVLSQGQKRRVALARLLVAPRPLWLLDEPTAALDTQSTGRLMTLIERHRREGGIVIVATHSTLSLDNLSELDLANYRAGMEESDTGGHRSDEDYWLADADA